MLKPLFEVQGLRIAVADDRTSLKGDDGPVTEDGEQLGSGWVEIVPGASYRVNAGEVLGLVGESASGKSLMLMGAFGLLPFGARVIGGTTRYKDHEYKPFHPGRAKTMRPHARNASSAESLERRLPDTPMTYGRGSSVRMSDSCFRTRSEHGRQIWLSASSLARCWRGTQTCQRRR